MLEIHGILDTESVGLHGEGFATALTVIDSNRAILNTVYFGCPDEAAKGSDADREWIKANVVPYLPPPNCSTPSEVRNSIWRVYYDWKNKLVPERNATFTLWADCGFPVEARFFAACIDENLPDRAWESPYPFQEIATIRTALGLDPTLAYDLPEDKRHNPVHETQYIAIKLVEWLEELEVLRAKMAS